MTLASTIDHCLAAGAGRSRGGAAAYRAARRHTMLVRVLRIAIPIVAVAAVVGIVAAPFLRPLEKLAGVSIGSVGISNGKVRMETPRLAGYRKDNKPYEVVATAALQDIRNPTQIELDTLTARLQVEREGWVTVEARSGLFDSQRERLKLIDEVKVRTESGYDIRMRTADIDFKAGTVASPEPVRVNLGTTTIEAQSLDVKDSGALIAFSGRVRAVIENAPAKVLAGPERVGEDAPPSPPSLDRQGAAAPAAAPAALPMVVAPLPPSRPAASEPVRAVRSVYGSAATASNAQPSP